MRAFVAIDIPSNIRERIRDLIGALKPLDPNIRWARPEGVHITLKFLGEVPLPKVEQVSSALSNVKLPASFRVGIEGCGYFPNERSPRVAWLGIEAGMELSELAKEVETALEPLGFAPEQRAFSPHLTLGRLREPGKIRAVQEALREREPLSFGSFEVAEFYLYESKLSPNGSIYSKVAHFEISANRNS